MWQGERGREKEVVCRGMSSERSCRKSSVRSFGDGVGGCGELADCRILFPLEDQEKT